MAAAAQTADVEAAWLEPALLLSHVTGYSRTRLYAFPDSALSVQQLMQLDDLLERRCTGEPLAYLTGEREFWSLPLKAGRGALIPRPDTELLVEQAVRLEPDLPPGCIMDLGTGTGAIALALAQEIDDRPIIAIERQWAALSIASDNTRRHGQDRVALIQASWLDAMADRVAALIIANPPYLADDDPHLATLRYEPRSALVSHGNGLADLNQIIDQARRVGRPGCALLLEHGKDQGEAVRQLLQHYNYISISTSRDLAGHERASLGYLPEQAVS